MEASKIDVYQMWELAKQIVELDVLRDEKWEHLNQLAGGNAHELLRKVQNS
ncbi:hypothetical protein J2S09_001038 [Bacillus fengqiuensis]|nr:hypothetical protein [Bacillus fengqiuensis]